MEDDQLIDFTDRSIIGFMSSGQSSDAAGGSGGSPGHGRFHYSATRPVFRSLLRDRESELGASFFCWVVSNFHGATFIIGRRSPSAAAIH